MHPIKTGLLCIPTYDESAVDAVRSLLHRTAPHFMILADRHVESRLYLVEEVLRRWCDEDELDLILTLGGTMPAPGPGPHEVAPEATLGVIERAMPGLPEAMRAFAYEASALAPLDRGVAGIRGRTLIVNLPAGAGAALFLEAIVELLAPAVAHIREDADAPALWVSLSHTAASSNVEEVQPVVDTPPAESGASRRSGKALDADEFAAFLRRQLPET